MFRIYMKRICFLLCVFLLTGINAFADTHDVKAFYVEVSKAEAEKYNDYLEFDDRYFVKTKMRNGVYEIEIGDKIDSKFYQIRHSDYFMLFRYSPYLYRFDEGILKVTNGYDAAEFIEKE